MEEGNSFEDPFLAAHHLGGLIFTAAEGIAPFSIRDQLIRASLLVEHLVMDGELKPRKRGLIIKGGGVAGVAAAFRAVELGVPVILYEPTGLLHVQRSSSRYVSPHLYDWPASRWREEAFPVHGEVQMRWRSGPALQVVGAWVTEFEALRDSAHLIGIDDLSGSKVLENLRRDVAEAEGQGKPTSEAEYDFWTARYAEDASRWGAELAVVLDCSGRPAEQCSIDRDGKERYRGPSFWESDALDLPNFGRGSAPPGNHCRILISGGGDGAIQDLLRIFFPALTPGEVLTELFKGAALDRCRLQIEEILREDADLYSRHSIWLSPEDQVFANAWMEERVKNALASLPEGDWSRLQGNFQRAMQPRALVTVLLRKAHFASCFLLNRFLALLLEKCFGATGPSDGSGPWLRMVRGATLVDVRANSGEASLPVLWKKALGGTLEAHFDLQTMPSQEDVAASEWELVIVRHGPKPRTLPPALVGRPRHLLPHSFMPQMRSSFQTATT